jgi:hypothetical protein
MILKRLVNHVSAQRREQRQAELYRNLIRHEAKIGGELFGPVPKGHRREFFCLDRRTWVWHEEWTDESGNYQARTTRYDVRPDGILKAQDGQQYQQASPDEVQNLYQAAKLYYQRIKHELYNSVV